MSVNLYECISTIFIFQLNIYLTESHIRVNIKSSKRIIQSFEILPLMLFTARFIFESRSDYVLNGLEYDTVADYLFAIDPSSLVYFHLYLVYCTCRTIA